ncbi:cytochrome c maturation protein CcmE [Microaerobacter geothermalis]|uniref:cytochrome c maturation protein CcmE n=1 Tax=Microaerobacter geothermalis TaxID=674972 RepID=UPI001F431400|nr:cytochrome c maturation protein CcmE [Microaerobacter geothermalis]MCF6092541.1 cytochrome c maturation protein CcmE [Microaerobacter geothermalis]
MKVRTKVTIAAVVVIGIIVALVTMGMSQASTYYLTVDEYLAKADKWNDRPVKVSGTIVGDSVNWNPQTVELRFDMKSEEGQVIPVYYKGLKPDNFVDGWEAIVEGKMDDSGQFVASQLLIKCPSKYEAVEEEKK